MRILRLTLAGVLALSGPIVEHAGQAGWNTGPGGAGPAPRFVQMWDGNGSGWHPAPGGWAGDRNPNPHHPANGKGTGLARIGRRTNFMAFGVRQRHGASRTLDGVSLTFPTATTVTGARCGIPTPNGEARIEAGAIPKAYG